MYVSHKLKLIFVRVPKTGSTSVYNGYRHYHGNWDQHWGIHPLPQTSQTATAYKKLFPDYRWIAGIRHPLTWLPSYHHWAKGADSFHKDHFGGKPDDNIYRFLHKIKFTPFDWVEHPDIDIEWYKLEEPGKIEDILGFKLARHNPAPVEYPKFRFIGEDEEVFREKFKRELAAYE